MAWLGENKIEEIAGLETLTALTQLDIQNNRLGEALRPLHALSELYLACNAIHSVENDLPVHGALSTIDLSHNGVDSIAGLDEFDLSPAEAVVCVVSGAQSEREGLRVPQDPLVQLDATLESLAVEVKCGCVCVFVCDVYWFYDS